MNYLYNKKHSVLLLSNKDNRKIILKIEIETTNLSVSNKELFIRLTDGDSLSFLFCLKINNENFQELKNQQGLLVDLCAFGQKLIDLLDLCKSEENCDNPKYILQICGNGDINNATGSSTPWTLNFIETNPFKHLTHLSLKFCHGDVDQFKNYLIDCLKNCRMENSSLSSQLNITESSLSKKLKDTEISLNDAKDQLHKLQLSSRIQLEELRTKLELQISKDKDKLIETESYYKTKYDQERQDVENNFQIKIRNYEAKIHDQDRTNKCLCDENSKLESELRELKLRYNNLDESYKQSTLEIQSLRRNKELCDKTTHESECQIQKMHTKIAVLEQEVRDKDQILSRTQDLYNTEQETKTRYLDESQKRARQIEKYDKVVKNLNDEVAKGNEIIQKLQTDIKHCHSKIKVRTQITTEQEKVLGDRESEMKRLNLELDNLKKELQKKEEESEKINNNVEQLNKKLEEANHVIKTNENVINWLNRQVTEYELTKQKTGYIGVPPRSNPGTGYSTCTDSTVKYRPLSTTSNNNKNGENITNFMLAGIVNRGKLVSGSNSSADCQTQQQTMDPSRNFTPTSLSTLSDNKMSDNKISNQQCGIESKYLIKSSINSTSSNNSSSSWNKFLPSHNAASTMRNQISNTCASAASIPEETEANNSSHQQSLSSAYFPKPLLGPR